MPCQRLWRLVLPFLQRHRLRRWKASVKAYGVKVDDQRQLQALLQGLLGAEVSFVENIRTVIRR